MLSVVGDVPVDSGAPVMTSSISKICRLSLSEVLLGVGCSCVDLEDLPAQSLGGAPRGRVFVRVCERLYCVSQKKNI